MVDWSIFVSGVSLKVVQLFCVLLLSRSFCLYYSFQFLSCSTLNIIDVM